MYVLVMQCTIGIPPGLSRRTFEREARFLRHAARSSVRNRVKDGNAFKWELFESEVDSASHRPSGMPATSVDG